MTPHQRDMFTKRYRAQSGPPMRENAMQVALVQRIAYLRYADVLAFHCPNGEKRDVVTGAILKKMGTMPGVADLIIIRGGRVIFLELKRERSGRQSDAQKDFAVQAERAGAEYVLFNDLDEATKFLIDRQILKPALGVIANEN